MLVEKLIQRTGNLASGLIMVGLLLFTCAQVLPVSGKAINNIAYALILLPTLPLLLLNPARTIQQLRPSLPLWFFLGTVLIVSLAHQSSGHAKSALYVFLFCAGTLLTLTYRPRTIQLSYGALTALLVLLLGLVGHEWLSSYLAHQTSPRLALWGRAENPIYAGLLSVSAFVFAWQFFQEKNSQPETAARYLAATASLLGCCLAAIVFFQARSALLGFLVFIAAQLYLRGKLKYTLVLFLALLIGLLASGVAADIYAKGLNYRPQIWLDALSRLQSECNLMIGCGQTEEVFIEYKGTHSGYVGTLYRHGLIGFAAFLYFAIWYFRQGLRTKSSWFLISLVGWGGMLSAMDGFVGNPHAWWVFFWLPTLAAIHEFNTSHG